MTIAPSEDQNIIINIKQDKILKEMNESFALHLQELEKKEKDALGKTQNGQDKTEKELLERTRELFEDLKSVYKTGLTVEEAELLKKTREEIEEEMNKEPRDDKKIQELLDKLEKKLNKEDIPNEKIALHEKNISGFNNQSIELLFEIKKFQEKQSRN